MGIRQKPTVGIDRATVAWADAHLIKKVDSLAAGAKTGEFNLAHDFESIDVIHLEDVDIACGDIGLAERVGERGGADVDDLVVDRRIYVLLAVPLAPTTKNADGGLRQVAGPIHARDDDCGGAFVGEAQVKQVERRRNHGRREYIIGSEWPAAVHHRVRVHGSRVADSSGNLCHRDTVNVVQMEVALCDEGELC